MSIQQSSSDSLSGLFPRVQHNESGARMSMKKTNEVFDINSDNQIKGIIKPLTNDILLGRGHRNLNHPGNQRFRQYVQDVKVSYVATPKSEKALFSKIVFNAIKNLNPPGRYLKQDSKTGLWFEISNKEALKKTRGHLREGTQLIKAQLGRNRKNDVDDSANMQLYPLTPNFMNRNVPTATPTFSNNTTPDSNVCELQQSFKHPHLLPIAQNSSSEVFKNKARRSSQSSMPRASFSSLVGSFINIDDYESKDETFDLSENEEFCVKNLNKARRTSLLRASFITLDEFSVNSQLSQ